MKILELQIFQNKTNTENPDSLNATDSAYLYVPEISTEGLNKVNNGKQMNNSKAPTFVDVEINEQEFVKQMTNDNTVRETKTVMNRFNKFVSQTLNKENVHIELLNPTELDNLISKFL